MTTKGSVGVNGDRYYFTRSDNGMIQVRNSNGTEVVRTTEREIVSDCREWAKVAGVFEGKARSARTKALILAGVESKMKRLRKATA